MAPKGSPAERPKRGPYRMTKLEARHGEIVGMLAVHTPRVEICRELGVAPSNLWLFVKRHQAEIEEATERRNRRVADYIVANQVDRIAELQWWYDKTRAEVAEHGITVEEVITSGDKESTITTREYRATLVKEARGILRDAAEELGQIKQPAKTEVNDRRTYVLQLVNGDHSDTPQLG